MLPNVYRINHTNLHKIPKKQKGTLLNSIHEARYRHQTERKLQTISLISISLNLTIKETQKKNEINVFTSRRLEKLIKLTRVNKDAEETIIVKPCC